MIFKFQIMFLLSKLHSLKNSRYRALFFSLLCTFAFQKKKEKLHLRDPDLLLRGSDLLLRGSELLLVVQICQN